MKITVIGTGYVGLVAGACLVDMGNQVICIDNNEAKLKNLEKCIVKIDNSIATFLKHKGIV